MIDELELRRMLSITYNDTTKTWTVTGTSGNDVMYAAWKYDGTLRTMRLSDGTTTQDTIYYVGPYQTVTVNFSGLDGNDIIDGSATISGFSTTDTPFFHKISIDGGAGADSLFASDGGDTISGGNGNDLIYGGAGANLLQGGNNNDEIHGGAGNDTLYGQSGADTLYGDSGSDLMNGGTDIDVVYGADGVEGNDTLVLDAGELYSADKNDIVQ